MEEYKNWHDYNPEKSRTVRERRVYVVHLRRQGLKFREIAVKLGISSSRAHSIYRAGAHYLHKRGDI